MSLTEKIFSAGIVGCGGAGFPTHVKYSAKAEWLIVNAAECEPLLRTDRYIVRNHAAEIISACLLAKEQLGAENCVIALKEHYAEEVAALKKAVEETGADVEIKLLNSFYPAGDEQTLVCEVTGKAVPPGGIPLDVGCVVSNAATMYAIYQASLDIPFTDKYITVTGEVNSPTVLKVPVGTSFEECLSLAGGVKADDYCVISGGPMMGRLMTSEDAKNAFVTKTTSGIIVLPSDSLLPRHDKISVSHMLNRAKSSCIQCSLCTQMCPRNLMGHPIEPHKIMRKTALCSDLNGILDNKDIVNASLCCECGICELYACPMGLQPRRINSMIKKALAETGTRYPKGEGAREINKMREMRQVPTKRAAARAGVLDYYDYEIKSCMESVPKKVCISLRQGIGAPSEVKVKDNCTVRKGELIAVCPEGKLGSDIHASIDGKVTLTDTAVIITAE